MREEENQCEVNVLISARFYVRSGLEEETNDLTQETEETFLNAAAAGSLITDTRS